MSSTGDPRPTSDEKEQQPEPSASNTNQQVIGKVEEETGEQHPNSKTLLINDESNAESMVGMRRLLDGAGEIETETEATEPVKVRIDPPIPKSYSSSPDCGTFSAATARYPLHTPRFKRIDFDDIADASVEERKPAWRQWQDSIKDSYHKVRKAAERSCEENAFLDSQLQTESQRRINRRSESPFEGLSAKSPSMQRPSFHATKPRTTGVYDETGPYAAPAVQSSQGIELKYGKKADDIEARLLKSSILPASMKTVTLKEFRKGPAPAVGSASEAFADETDYQAFMPRPYYSRPNRDDPDYFDFDLQHSVDMFKRPEGKYVPRGPQRWEEEVLGDAKTKGAAPVSGYMFTKGDTDWRTSGTSYLSAALRTPSYWEQRFSSIGREVRESNPISLDSLARNKPITSRWTEYRDPELEDLTDSDDE